MWIVGPFMRYFDFESAERVNMWIANSKEVAGRIKKFYRKDSVVIYPPIEVRSEMGKISSEEKNYYLMISRIVGGKGIAEGRGF
jgi:hypothetical protein